jgi:ABC-type phosphate transport system substrate-binding protein
MITKRLLFVLGAGVLALVTACGGGGSKAAQSPPSHSPAASHSTSHSSSPAKPKTSGIPQHNGGDHDGDNTGGPSDGDGNI